MNKIFLNYRTNLNFILLIFIFFISNKTLATNLVSIPHESNLIIDKKNKKLTLVLGKHHLELQPSINLNGKKLKITSIESVKENEIWTEVAGWLNKDGNFWYNLRVSKDSQSIYVSLAVMDRHDNHKVSAQWSKYWKKRKVSDYSIQLQSNQEFLSAKIQQASAFSGGSYNNPVIKVFSGSGIPRWRVNRVNDSMLRLNNFADEHASNRIEILPNKNGEFELELFQNPLLSPYPAANAVPVSIIHQNGKKDIVVNQGESRNLLGSYTLNEKSKITLNGKADEKGDTLVFQNLLLKSIEKKQNFMIGINRQEDQVYQDKSISIFIRDFWKHHPIRFSASGNVANIQLDFKKVIWTGGAGVSIDFVVVGSQAKKNWESAVNRIPRKINYPDWWHSIDGHLQYPKSYRTILDLTESVIIGNDVERVNSGWKNHGDYQIGYSYFNSKGDAIENWAGLQYDLATGLINVWLKTQNMQLWNRAHASIRNIMNIQTAKFAPYTQKRSGAGLRKGECEKSFSHWCQEPIPEFNYHARALLLYSHLTDEMWPKEIAQMLIDNSAYFAHTRLNWLLKADRALAWTLRNLFYGASVFLDGTAYNHKPEGGGFLRMPKGTSYQELLNQVVVKIIKFVENEKKLPGHQPVWQAQIIDGLALAYDSDFIKSEYKSRLKRSILQSLDFFMEEELRKSENGFEMLYYRDKNKQNWRSAETYAWLWLNALSYGSELSANPKYQKKADDIYLWLLERYLNEKRFKTIRSWSVAIGFADYFLSKKFLKN